MLKIALWYRCIETSAWLGVVTQQKLPEFGLEGRTIFLTLGPSYHPIIPRHLLRFALPTCYRVDIHRLLSCLALIHRLLLCFALATR